MTHHRSTRLRVAVLVLAGSSLAACSGAAAAPDLAGTTFVATQARGHDLVDGSEIRLSFEEGQVSAAPGCNTHSGGATWDGGTLEVADELATTMMACDDALMAQDAWVAELLTSSPAVALEDRTLTVGDDTTGLTLEQE